MSARTPPVSPRGPTGPAAEETTDFGFEQVPIGEKRDRVRALFDSVASRYDLMNDLMSFGLHRAWKRYAVLVSGVRAGQRVLDLAGGTGDLARLFAQRVGETGRVVLGDFSGGMLELGRRRLVDAGAAGVAACVRADAEALPFPDRIFDCVSIGFGLRNVTDKSRALAEMHRVLRPGGCLLVLEFSRVRVPALRSLYDAYSFRVLPWLGERVAGDGASYRYLAESIRRHPDQDTMLGMLAAAGFERRKCFNLSGGVVALHRGYRL